MLSHFRYLPVPRHAPARIAQDPNTHRDLEGVSHHPWVNSYRHYYKLNNKWSIGISKFGFLVATGEMALGVFTANPVLTVHGLWGMVANAVCAGINKLSHATIHYTQMTERLYNRKVHIYREIIKDPELSIAIDSSRPDGAEQDERRRTHIDFLIESALIDTLSPEEARFRKNRFLRYVFYDHFENRRNVVLGGAIGYQAGTGVYAVTSDATAFLLAYPARALLTSMVYWHFKREDARQKGEPLIGNKHTAPVIDKTLSAVVQRPATLSIPFECAAATNYGILTANDVGFGLAAFASARPVEGTLHMLSAFGNAGFILTSLLSAVAEMDQGDGIDWKQKPTDSARRGKSVWRESIPIRPLRNFVNWAMPQVAVDKTLFDNTNYLSKPTL